MARTIIVLISCGLFSAARSAPGVVSINLCTDQLLLNVAAADQILSLSWLAADPDESMLADAARTYPLNRGTAEEVIRLAPDVVTAGRYTNPYTKSLLKRLGFTVVEVDPARSIADIERNLLLVGEAIERTQAAESVIAALRIRLGNLKSFDRQTSSVQAIVMRPGGYTIERDSIASEMLMLAGIEDQASAMGLDAWGSLSVETLLRADPQLLIVSDYKLDTASLANAWFTHPAIATLARQLPTVSLPVSYWACGAPQSLDSVPLLVDSISARQ
ncbi:MAG: ABC transporter substrate-binding protein [Gammaproteobacteria bacterium]